MEKNIHRNSGIKTNFWSYNLYFDDVLVVGTASI